MAFRFPLAAVLRLREIEEQRAERLLTETLAAIARTHLVLSALDAQLTDAAAVREAELRAPLAAAALQDSYAFSAGLKERRLSAEAHLRQLEQDRETRIRAYQAAHQALELLSTMHNDQHARFLTAHARREQKTLDDAFIARLRR